MLIPQPLSQTNLRDLPLLLRRFAQLGRVIILQSPLQNLQNFRARLSRRAHDEDSAEPPLVLAVPFCQRRS